MNAGQLHKLADSIQLPGETMEGSDNRQLSRDSLFLTAEIRVNGVDGAYPIRVRNLSRGGMMGEGQVRVVRGASVSVNIRNLGWVVGSIAWVQDNRFGVAFRDEIDPQRAREPVGKGERSPRYTRPPLRYGRSGLTVRKI